MVKRPYIPDTGDIVWLSFSPQSGHEQAGRRPALVLSPQGYNKKAEMALFCPITSQIKDYPFEVHLPSDGAVTGVILADQVRSLDWRARRCRFDSKASPRMVSETLEKLSTLLGQNG